MDRSRLAVLAIAALLAGAGCPVGPGEQGPDAGSHDAAVLDASSGTPGPDAATAIDASAAPDASPLDAGTAIGADASTTSSDAASPLALSCAITAPAASDSLVVGETLALQGTASGGTPPYSFAWLSDHDGTLGTGASMVAAALTVNDHLIQLKATDSLGATATSAAVSVHVLPIAFDWSHKVLPTAPPAAGDWMTPVKNQSTCGSCWAFAALGAMEAKWNIQNGNPDLDIDLSEQFVIDCHKGAVGCGGGAPEQALDPFIKTTGVPVETCDPFVGHNATCVTKCQDGSTLALWRITGIHSFVPPVCDPPAVRKWLRDAIVHDGPSPRSMSGMYGWNSATSKCDNAQGDHYVVLVGYDHAAGVFIAKNSWGATWNGNGYFKIAYGSCGMDGSGTTIDQVIPP